MAIDLKYANGTRNKPYANYDKKSWKVLVAKIAGDNPIACRTINLIDESENRPVNLQVDTALKLTLCLKSNAIHRSRQPHPLHV